MGKLLAMMVDWLGTITKTGRRDAFSMILVLFILSLITIQCEDEGKAPIRETVIHPAWSPTNNLIAVFRNDFQPSEAEGGCNSTRVIVDPGIASYSLRLVDNVGRFLAEIGRATYPGVIRWSQDGQTLAFTEVTAGRQPAVKIATISGAAISVLSLVDAVDVAWSPDGSRIAVAAKQATDSVEHLYVVNADGSNLHELNPTITGAVFAVRWSSRDKISILYHQDYRGYLGFVNGDGSNFMVVDSIGLVFALIDWSPDGDRLIHTSAAAPYKLYSLDPVSFQRTVLAEGEFFTSISFAPARGLVGFTNSSGFYVVDTAGTNQRFIGQNISLPSWSPDGREVVYTSGEKLLFQQIP